MSVAEQVSSSIATLTDARVAAKTQVAMLDKIARSIISIQNVDPCPQKFVGKIDNYRFTTGAKGQMPTHRFEVFCGNGLSLHIEATPSDFAAAMIEMDTGDITPKKMNSRLCIVARNDDKMAPVKMLSIDDVGRDRWGNYLWVGAFVTQANRMGIIELDTDGELLVNFDGEKEYWSPESLLLVL